MLNQRISQFIAAATASQLIDEMDVIYLTNRLLKLFKISEFEVAVATASINLLDALDGLVEAGVSTGIIEDIQYQKEQLAAEIMDLLTPYPSQINQRFWDLYQESPQAATTYFYQLSQANDYIKTREIAKNIAFTSPSPYGDLEITINLSKPEKDPKEIALAKLAPTSHYPKCLLCMENEGYQGRVNHPARQNHRIIRLVLNQQAYGYQYSPYQYYSEHSIFLNQAHIPMAVDQKCFENLLAIVTILPHYFAGSNADLPIVGGSILSHDHYQGGRYCFPMDKAKPYQSVKLIAFPELSLELVHWPMTVLRLRGNQREDLVAAATFILNQWRTYSDEALDILATSEAGSHNTITPIARRKGEAYELDLVLRNNRTSQAHPDGIFHPHADVQHIKKENIGLIEVMGLAILPPRLLGELDAIAAYLTGQGPFSAIPAIHHEWVADLADQFDFTRANVKSILHEQVGQKFARVLEDAGVYKLDEAGKQGLLRFIDHLNEGR